MIFPIRSAALSVRSVSLVFRSLTLCVLLTSAVVATGQVQPVAPVDVRDGWIRPAVPGQSGTGAFMTLTAPSGSRLISISTPVAGVAEVHEMMLDGDTMRMRAVKGGLDLPARQTVELKPGGFHVMLMDLKQPILKGTVVPLVLRFEDATGVRSSLELKLPVGAPASTGTDPSAEGHDHKHKH